jgi:hypothetical protein
MVGVSCLTDVGAEQFSFLAWWLHAKVNGDLWKKFKKWLLSVLKKCYLIG